MKNIFLALTFILFLYSCNSHEEFDFKYSLENFGNYKVSLSIKELDSTYKLEEYNYLFDNFEGKKKPILLSGKLSKTDFDIFKKHIVKSNLLKLKDNYGFNNASDASGKILYQLSYLTKSKEKYVSIMYPINQELTPELINLINHCNQKISQFKSVAPIQENPGNQNQHL